MKKIIILIVLFNVNLSWSQENEWLTYSLDSVVSVEMPGIVHELDTIANGIKIYQRFSRVNHSFFIAQRVLFEENETDTNTSKLPYDLKSLQETYNGVLKGLIKTIPYKFYSKDLIDVGKFKGYNSVFKDSIGKSAVEVQIVLLNKYLYILQYFNNINFDNQEKNFFFKSIKIKDSDNVSQFIGKPKESSIAYILGKYTGYILLIIGIVIFIVKKMS